MLKKYHNLKFDKTTCPDDKLYVTASYKIEYLIFQFELSTYFLDSRFFTIATASKVISSFVFNISMNVHNNIRDFRNNITKFSTNIGDIAQKTKASNKITLRLQQTEADSWDGISEDVKL